MEMIFNSNPVWMCSVSRVSVVSRAGAVATGWLSNDNGFFVVVVVELVGVLVLNLLVDGGGNLTGGGDWNLLGDVVGLGLVDGLSNLLGDGVWDLLGDAVGLSVWDL